MFREEVASRSLALRREREIKSWTRQRKLDLIQQQRLEVEKLG